MAENTSWYSGLGNFMYNPNASRESVDTQGNPMAVKTEHIMGMTPASFSSVLGQMGAAFGPKGSWQEKLGQIGASLGNATLQAEIEKRRHGAYMKTIKELMGKLPPESLVPASDYLHLTPSQINPRLSLGAVDPTQFQPNLTL